MTGNAGRTGSVRSMTGSTPVGEATYHSLRQEILSCSLPPGSTLTETSVMEKYGVGKSTCRLALARLVQEGFIQSMPRQGYLVTPVTLKDVEELFALRLLLEPAAAKLAAGKADVRALAEIEACIRTNKASRNKGNRIGFFLDANREFHRAIALASGNTRLVNGISTLLDEMKRLVALGFVDRDGNPHIDNDHIELMDALKRGDAERAERIAFRHVETFRDMTLERVMQSIRESSQSRPLVAQAAR